MVEVVETTGRTKLLVESISKTIHKNRLLLLFLVKEAKAPLFLPIIFSVLFNPKTRENKGFDDFVSYRRWNERNEFVKIIKEK